MNLQEAKEELAKRILARKYLVEFIKYTYPGYIAENAHLYVCSVLEQFNRGVLRNVILSAPPRFGKSEIVSVRSPAWFFGDHLPTGKQSNIILCSYTAELAIEKSRECRNLVESPIYHAVYPNIRTSDDSRASNNWEVINLDKATGKINAAKFIAAGIGGSITGFGAARGIVDDPIKNMEEALSEVLQEKQHTWYKSVFRTRLTPDAGTLIMATRWATNDLIGRIIAERKEPWVIIRLPALAETQEVRDINNKKLGLPAGLKDPLLRDPDEPLTPNRYDKEWLLTTKNAVGGLIWQAMYQGVPTLAEGNLFKREHFKIIDLESAEPEKNQVFRIRYWDKAASDNVGCFTAGVLIAYYFNTRKFRVEDVKRFQYNALAREQIIRRTAEEDREKYGEVEIWIEQEPGSGGKESAQNTVVNLTGFAIFVDKVTGSKDARIQAYLSQAMAGNVELVRAGWNQEFIDEHLEIPNGLYRDQSDAAGGAINKLILKRQGVTYITTDYQTLDNRDSGLKLPVDLPRSDLNFNPWS